MVEVLTRLNLTIVHKYNSSIKISGYRNRRIFKLSKYLEKTIIRRKNKDKIILQVYEIKKRFKK